MNWLSFDPLQHCNGLAVHREADSSASHQVLSSSLVLSEDREVTEAGTGRAFVSLPCFRPSKPPLGVMP